VRSYFAKTGGRLAESGSVSYLFEHKGLIIIDPDVADEDTVTEAAIEGGAEDVAATDDGGFEITTAPEDMHSVQKALDTASVKYSSVELSMIPTTSVTVTGKEAGQVMRLMELLEDHDDVQKVYANFDIPDEEMDS
jgi:transcriptional/translational regulatory protein YebC/TACO1